MIYQDNSNISAVTKTLVVTGNNGGFSNVLDRLTKQTQSVTLSYVVKPPTSELNAGSTSIFQKKIDPSEVIKPVGIVPKQGKKKRKPTIAPTNSAVNALMTNALPKGEYAVDENECISIRKGIKDATVMVRVRRKGICKAKDVGKFDGKNISELLIAANELKTKIEAGENIHVETFRDAFLMYQDEINAKQRSEKGHISRENKIIEGLGSLKLTEITPTVVLELLESYSSSAGTYNRYLSRVRRIFNTFQRLGLIMSNPAFGLSKKYEKPNPYEAMDKNEVQTFIKLLQEDPNPLHSSSITISLLSGIRIGAVISLKKDALNFKERTITLVQSKNGRRQTFPMGDMVYVILEKLVQESPSEYVFYSEKSKTGHVAHPTECMKRVVKKMHDLGITTKHLVIHSARHTAATMWYSQTADLVKVSRALGHSSLHSTLRYTHTDVSSIREMTNNSWASDALLAQVPNRIVEQEND